MLTGILWKAFYLFIFVLVARLKCRSSVPVVIWNKYLIKADTIYVFQLDNINPNTISHSVTVRQRDYHHTVSLVGQYLTLKKWISHMTRRPYLNRWWYHTYVHCIGSQVVSLIRLHCLLLTPDEPDFHFWIGLDKLLIHYSFSFILDFRSIGGGIISKLC